MAKITKEQILDENFTNWDLAFGWGDHALAGYATTGDLAPYLRSDIADIKTIGDLFFLDNVASTFGSVDQGRLFHDGNDLFLRMEDVGSDNDFIIQNGSVTFASFIRSTGSLLITGNITASSLITSGGTSSDFVKGDGTLDSSVYLSDAPSDGNEYVRLNGTWSIATGGGASQLTDLSDVNTAIPTNRNVLIADGVDWESRALVEADISDLQSYLITESDPIFTASEAFNITAADITNLSNLSGINSGDQTSIVGITGTKAQFDTSLTDGNFLYVGDVVSFPGFTDLATDYGYTPNSYGTNQQVPFMNAGGTDFQYDSDLIYNFSTNELTVGNITNNALSFRFSPSNGIDLRTKSTSGGWARGFAVSRDSDSARIGGFGFLGNNETLTSFEVGFGTSWWGADSVFEITPSGNVQLDGTLTIGTASNPGSAPANFLGKTGSNLVVTRTPAEVRADIGAAATTDIQDWLRADAADIKTAGTLTFNDNIRLRIGTDPSVDGAQIFNTGTYTYMDLYGTTAPNFYIRDGATTAFSFFAGVGQFRAEGAITALSYRTIGGTSTEFLKADGTVDTNTYLTSYTETDTLASVTSRGATTSDNLTLNGIISINDVNVTGHTYGSEIDNGNSGTADTIDFTTSNFQLSTLTDNCTFTFTAPTGPATLILKLVQDVTGSRTVTWPATVTWAGGKAPTLTTTPSGVDIITFYYDGTNYHGSYVLDLQ